MKGNRIIDCRSDVIFCERLYYFLPVKGTDGKLMVYMIATRQLFGQNNVITPDQGAICLRASAAEIIKLLNLTQLYTQNCRLYLVKAAVVTDALMLVSGTASMIAKNFYTLCHLFIAGNDHPAVTVSTKILAGKKAETTTGAHS